MLHQDKQTRVKYKTTHPLYGKDNVFDSWMTLCECTLDLAEAHIIKGNQERLKKLSEEMMATTTEYIDEP